MEDVEVNSVLILASREALWVQSSRFLWVASSLKTVDLKDIAL